MTSPEAEPRRPAPAFTAGVLARLPAADRARARRRRVAMLSRPTFAVLLGLLGALVGASALPAYGADGTRVAVRAVSWMMVGQSVVRNLSGSLIGDLRLEWLPIGTAALLLATVGLGARRHMRRPDNQAAGERDVPMIDGRKALVSLLALVVIGAALGPALAFGRGYVHLGKLRVERGETLVGTQLVVGGDVELLGRTTSPLVVVGGDASVAGRAEDDVVAVLGSVLLGPGSVAGRDVVAVGGRVLRADGSLVLGNVAGQELRWTGSEIRSESDLPAAIVARARLALLGAAAGMLLVIGAVTLLPWLVVLVGATARGAPLQSGLLGLAGLACGPLLILPLGLSLVGAPLAGILMIALVLCWWLGAASVGFLIGRRLLRLRGRDGSLTRAALTGGALLGALVGVPVVGGVVLVLAGAAGAGAVLLALLEGEFGSARSPEATLGMMVYE
ncbi:MAG TPA: hypothetical protein VGL23_00330 [Chloroflexota bacterium]